MNEGVTIRYDETDGFVLSLSVPKLRSTPFEATNQVLSLGLMDLAEQLEAEGV